MGATVGRLCRRAQLPLSAPCPLHQRLRPPPRPPPACAPTDAVLQEEKDAVTEVFNSAIQCLKEQDRELPFIKAMLPMLQAGVAVHHSGTRARALPTPPHPTPRALLVF